MKRTLFHGCLLLGLSSLAACSDDPVGPSPRPSPGQIGSSMQINVQTDDACYNPDIRTGQVVGVSNHAIVVADTANPSGGFTDGEYQAFADSFDKHIHPTITGAFGEPADIDGNGRIIIFYTRAVNELTPAGSDGYVGGFFHSRDLFPKKGNERLEGCLGSNEAEIFYMMVPDPTGTVNGNLREKNDVRGITLGTIAHEFQHLINSSRRLYVNDANDFESPWLNEGLSHIAEELMFYHLSGLGPKQNIGIDRLRSSRQAVDAFNSYQGNNFGRLERYFRNTAGQAAYSDSAGLGERGAIWHYLRYLADRTGGAEFWSQLVNSRDSGFTNLQRAIGQDLSALYRDWTITTYTDDHVYTLDANFQQPSWNYRSILPELIKPPVSMIVPRELEPRTPQLITLYGGGAAYLQFYIEPQQRAEIRVTPAAAAIPPVGACTAEAPSVVLEADEVYTPALGGGQTLCLNGGATGGRYVLVLTNVGRDVALSRQVNVTGYEINPPILAAASPVPVLLQAEHSPRSTSLVASGGAGGLARNYSLDARIRQQELTELAPLLGGRRGNSGARRLQASPALQAVPGNSDDLYISLVRVQ